MKAKKRSDINNYEVCRTYEEFRKQLMARTDIGISTDDLLFPTDTLAIKFECNEKLTFSACYRAYQHKLIEFGVSLRSGWLTDKGKQLLADKDK